MRSRLHPVLHFAAGSSSGLWNLQVTDAQGAQEWRLCRRDRCWVSWPVWRADAAPLDNPLAGQRFPTRRAARQAVEVMVRLETERC